MRLTGAVGPWCSGQCARTHELGSGLARQQLFPADEPGQFREGSGALMAGSSQYWQRRVRVRAEDGVRKVKTNHEAYCRAHFQEITSGFKVRSISEDRFAVSTPKRNMGFEMLKLQTALARAS